MAKFDMKEHDKRMREILKPPQKKPQPLSPETLDRLVQLGRQRRQRRGR